jgi:hypothetical protein
MTIRERLEAVLKKHFVVLGAGPHSLLDDLEKLWPQPSREALEKLIWPSPYSNMLHISFSTLEAVEQWVDHLMAWAQGEQAPKVWCEHMTPAKYFGLEGWAFQDSHAPLGMVYCLPLDNCPICAAPRPTA